MLLPIVCVLILLNSGGDTLNIWTKTKFKNVVVFNHFWKNTGFCPSSAPESRADFLLSPDEVLNLNFIGALPNKAITKIRVHWVLDLVRVSKVEKTGKPVFNFEHLDRLVEVLHRNGIHPIFELMGNPSNYFKDFNYQSEQWTELIRQIITLYSKKYGVSYVREWKFELMNEPDLKMYNFLNFTLENYLDYFHASEQAVPSLIGPAGLFRDNRKSHSLCWGLLDYCNLNPCNLEMITFHRKGDGIGSAVVDHGLELINNLISNYPNLKGIKFGNDEADIEKSWIKPLEWRADVRYAALVVQVVIGHVEQMLIRRNIPFELLSNDNAFLSYSPNFFTQRTLLARFQMNNTSPPHLQFFRKPVYSVMGMLSLLGNFIKDVRYYPGEEGYSYIVTSHTFGDVFLGTVVNDRVFNESYSINASKSLDINVRLNLGKGSVPGKYVVYLMDNQMNNPYEIWKNQGSSPYPNLELRRKMRQAEGFKRLFVRDIKFSRSHIKFVLKNVLVPSVFAVSACFEETVEPGPPTELNYFNVTESEILLFWKDTLVGSRCLLSYNVEFKASGSAQFHRINEVDSIFLSYHFDGVVGKSNFTRGVAGDYRVVAIDYWNRTGPYSNVLTIFV